MWGGGQTYQQQGNIATLLKITAENTPTHTHTHPHTHTRTHTHTHRHEGDIISFLTKIRGVHTMDTHGRIQNQTANRFHKPPKNKEGTHTRTHTHTHTHTRARAHKHEGDIISFLIKINNKNSSLAD
jgi:hypothetical protein